MADLYFMYLACHTLAVDMGWVDAIKAITRASFMGRQVCGDFNCDLTCGSKVSKVIV